MKTITELDMVNIAITPTCIALAQVVLYNGLDYSPEFSAIWGDDGYHLYSYGNTVCIVYDDQIGCMSKARIVARVI